MVSCDWLLSPDMFLRFICVTACINTSFLSIAKQHSIVWTYYIVLICLSMIRNWFFSHYLAIVNNAAMNIHVHACVDLSLGYIPRSEFLGHMLTLCFIFWGAARYFPKWLHYFTLSSAVCKASTFPRCSPTLALSISVIITILWVWSGI